MRDKAAQFNASDKVRFWLPLLLPAMMLLVMSVVWYMKTRVYGHPYRPAPTPLLTFILSGIPSGNKGMMIADRLLMILVPMLPALALFTRQLDRGRPSPIIREFSLYALVVSEMALVLALWQSFPLLSVRLSFAAMVSMLAAYFILIPVKEFVSRSKESRGAAAIALIAAGCVPMYIWFSHAIWEYTMSGTTAVVRMLIALAGYETSYRIIPGDANFGISVLLESRDFAVRILTPCSGAEGIFILYYVASIFLLLDWKFFRNRINPVNVYLWGFLYAMMVNTIRIAAVFVYAESVTKSTTARYGRKTMIDIFHSNIGWVIYAAAGALFIWQMYAIAAKQKARAAANP